MGIRIIEGNGDSGGYAVLYCSTSMRTFPWVFSSYEDALGFFEFSGERVRERGRRDLRELPADEQERIHDAWDELTEEARGVWTMKSEESVG